MPPRYAFRLEDLRVFRRRGRRRLVTQSRPRAKDLSGFGSCPKGAIERSTGI
jgi:hypothetical protein